MISKASFAILSKAYSCLINFISNALLLSNYLLSLLWQLLRNGTEWIMNIPDRSGWGTRHGVAR